MDANITLSQLTQSNNPTRRLKAMIGAKNFLSDGKSFVSFKFMKSGYVKIKLNAMDTYDMEFGKIRKFEYKVTKEFKGLYCDQLKSSFENHTKLYLSL